MLRCEIDVRSGADRLLYEGLPLLAPVLDELGDGALLIGGLATAVWLTARPVGLPVRATRDIDLGIDRRALGITRERTPVKPLLRKHEFDPGYAGEEFRFARKTSAGTFVVDLLVAPGASRARPPIVEPGLSSLAAPGLAYAFLRGPVPLELVLTQAEPRVFALRTIHLDAAFVMKASLVASGERPRADRRTTDTVDAVMLAAACTAEPDAMAQLAAHGRRSDVTAALAWIKSQFGSPRSAASRRVSEHVGSDNGGLWAVDVARRFDEALDRT
jgi:hypothetical protein